MKGILQKTREELEKGVITMRQAQERLYKAGWYTHVPNEAQIKDLLTKTY